MARKKIGIVGLGRFGRLWGKLLLPFGDVVGFDPAVSGQEVDSIPLAPLNDVLAADAIFYAVPISKFEEIIKEHLPLLEKARKGTLVADLLSVKVHPKSVLEKYLPKHLQGLLIHAMFGPDSVRVQGLPGQRIVLDRFKADDETYNFWREVFIKLELTIAELSAVEHDRLAASSQGMTHFVGRILGELDFKPTAIDTLGAKKLLEIKEQVCNDSPQLFIDLQTYNPFTLEMRVKLGMAQEKIYNQLLPNRIFKDRLVVGIQGGKGSFNEEAARYYLGRANVKEYELKYLYTTANVLKALHEGQVDRGQFAMHNSIGGIVHESVNAMSQYNFKIVEEFAIKISHTIMIRSDANFEEVDTVMAHPQVFRQCANNLKQKYSRLKQISGEGELIDHAKVAEQLGSKALPKNIATMGSKVLAQIHGLRIVEENLQDLAENYTSFLWVERP